MCVTSLQGKSTFIEALGCHVVREKSRRLAVLAIDPSSPKSGGSILGDKTRMLDLSRLENAFVRPSPTRGTLGGVARSSASAAMLCAAAGYDTIFIETVGVGQSEIAVASMCDLFTLLAAPGAGDELQGIKKGIMEMADVIVVNKADKGEAAQTAQLAASQIAMALRLVRDKRSTWFPRTLLCSAQERTGIDEVWNVMCEFHDTMRTSGALQRRRRAQGREWLCTLINEQLLQSFYGDEVVQSKRVTLERDLDAGNTTPADVADQLVQLYVNRRGSRQQK